MKEETARQLRKRLNREIEQAVEGLLRLEQSQGYHGVFNAIRLWMEKPYRKIWD